METKRAPESERGPEPEQVTIGTLLGDRNYLFIWIVGGLTGVTRWLQLLVMGLYTFEVTGSPLLVSMVPMLWMLPLALCGPLVGVAADRVDRKKLLLFSSGGVIALSVALASIAHAGALAYTHIAVASVLSGLFWTTDFPVRRRMLGDLSRGALSTAMSLDSATGNATRMAGPLLGGVMLQLFSMTGVFILSAAIYSLSLLLIALARVPAREPATTTPAFVRDLTAGIRFVVHDRRLRRIFAVTIVFNVWGFPFTSMIPVIGREHLGLDAVMVGVLSSMEGFGAFVGALLVAIMAKPDNFFRVYVGGTLVYLSTILYLSALISVAGGPYHSFVATLLALTVIGIAGACFAAMQSTLSYMGAAPEFRSRVLGVLTLCIGSGPIGFFNVGWMAELFGVPIALLIISLEGLFALLVLWSFGEDPEPASERAAG